ncbi:MAG: hypothetical protein HKN01_05880 [Acidimicrobiia bacterium]|nr:hypothetical protein [Acidimicrobiia bacterium]
MDQRRTVMRNFGLGLVLASPVAAFVSFAVFSIVFGEERFEGADGVTGLGVAVLALPLFLGIGVAAWAQFGGPVPTRTTVAIGAGTLGVLWVVLGVWSAVGSGSDPSIGGGILVLFGLASLATGIALWRSPRSNSPPSHGGST